MPLLAALDSTSKVEELREDRRRASPIEPAAVRRDFSSQLEAI
jgi:hypothetical protein